MGNLLGSPITEKDTHVGTTVDSNADPATSPDGGGLPFGISSMQGWRIHMEDAHIAQPFLYAEKLRLNDANSTGGGGGTSSGGSSGGGSGSGEDDANDKDSPGKRTAIEASLSTEEDDNDGLATEVNVTDETIPKKPSTSDTSSNDNKKYIRIPLPNHSLFAVFDGHGGSFAAEYASRNMLRVLCRSEGFNEYAAKWRGREEYLSKVRDGLLGEKKKGAASAAETPKKELDDKERLQQLQKRGRESDEKTKQIKEQVKKHLDGEVDISTTETTASSNTTTSINDEDNQELQYAQATYDHEMMTLLEHSLRDAFIDLDAEILREVRGDKVDDANLPYGMGYDLSNHALEGCVGHLPKEAGGDAQGDDTMTESNNDTTSSNNADHPTPSEDEDAGTTAVVVMTTPKWIVCANSGDSRAVYARSNHRAVPLSYDHKPEDEDEERRIREAGGYVSGGRVEGDLAVSRGLGDYRFKDLDAVLSGSRGEGCHRSTSILQRQIADSLQGGEGGDVPMFKPSEQKVSPVPDIIVQNRVPNEDEFIIIACDGIWDVQTNQECVRMVADIFEEGEGDLGLVCEEILDLCLIKGSKDNMTAAVIKLPKQTIGKGGGVSARRERRGASSGGGNGDENENGEQQVHLRRAYNPYSASADKEGGTGAAGE